MKPDIEFAREIISLSQNHLNALIGRNWPAMAEILEDEEEITLSLKLVATNRSAAEGEHADVDHRLKTTISFSKKFSDSIDAALSDPSQPELPLDGTVEIIAPSKQELFAKLTEEIGALMPGGVYQAITGRFIGDDQSEIGRTFKKAAKAIGWPQEAIDLVLQTAKQAGSIAGFLEIVNSQTVPAGNEEGQE